MAFQSYKLKYKGTMFGGCKAYVYGSTSIVSSMEQDDNNNPVRLVSISAYGRLAELPEDEKLGILYYLGMSPDKKSDIIPLTP